LTRDSGLTYVVIRDTRITTASMTVGVLILLLFLFQLKHFLCDWLFQTPWMYRNKGTFGHPGGIVHAGWQALATVLLLALLTAQPWGMVARLALAEFVIHYMTDWSKMNITRKTGWTPNDSEYWWLTGLDQFIHQMTYIGVIWVVVT